jgi:hypothetical protein
MNHWSYLGCLGSNIFLGVWVVGGLGVATPALGPPLVTALAVVLV